MDLFVDEKDWNPNAENNTGGFRPSYGQDYVKYNTYLQKLLREVDNKIVSYIDKHGDISPETILDIIDGNDKVLRQDQGIEFLDFAKQRFVDRYNSGLIGVSSRENGISYINQFARFLMSEHRGSHGPKNELLYISEITERIVFDFRNWFLGYIMLLLFCSQVNYSFFESTSLGGLQNYKNPLNPNRFRGTFYYATEGNVARHSRGQTRAAFYEL